MQNTGDNCGIVDTIIDSQKQQVLKAAIDLLPEMQRTTLLLRVKQGYKFSEIAQLLDCPVGTTKANFHHATTTLKKFFKEKTGQDS